MQSDHHWDYTVDLLVVGSGNGAMTASLCAHEMGISDLLLIEKSEFFGGTSALSGGGVWVPCNRYAKAAGAKDSIEEAKDYLKATIPADLVQEKMIDCYLQNAPKMIDFLHEHTRARYHSLEKYPDYFSDRPGAKPGHRSMEPAPISLSALGEQMRKMVPDGAMYMFGKYAITQVEAQLLVGRQKGWLKTVLRLVLQYNMDIPWRMKGIRASRRTTGGGAGIVRMRLSLLDRNIPLWLSTELKELIVEDERVVGVITEREGKTLRIQTRKGVILAAGGFEKNQAMREQYLPKPTNIEWSAGCKTNTGDAIRAGQKIGAATSLMDNAWWCTTMVIPGVPYPFLSIVTKCMPGTIVVNKAGKRFSNESQNYMSFLKETFAAHTQDNPCIPQYMIFDAAFKKKYRVYPLIRPDKMLPKAYFDEGFVAIADTIEELAEKLEIDKAGLSATIQRFNGFAKTGKDLDFKRGDAAYDRYYGDPSVQPNPCLGPLNQAPYYAILIQPGDFGTQGGMLIDTHARVLKTDNSPIEGLYACGNCTAAVLPTYPGPGSTLGPAMTFAYQAAKHLSGFKD